MFWRLVFLSITDHRHNMNLKYYLVDLFNNNLMSIYHASGCVLDTRNAVVHKSPNFQGVYILVIGRKTINSINTQTILHIIVAIRIGLLYFSPWILWREIKPGRSQVRPRLGVDNFTSKTSFSIYLTGNLKIICSLYIVLPTKNPKSPKCHFSITQTS